MYFTNQQLTNQQLTNQQSSSQQPVRRTATGNTIVVYSLQPDNTVEPRTRMTATWTTDNGRLICKWHQIGA